MRIPSLSEIPEQAPVEEGEYRLKITKAKEAKSGNTGREGLMLICSVTDEENAEPIFHRLWFPFEHEEKEKQTTMWRMVKEFMEAIGLDSSAGAGPEDFQGVEFDAMIGLEQDDNGRWRNSIIRVV